MSTRDLQQCIGRRLEAPVSTSMTTGRKPENVAASGMGACSCVTACFLHMPRHGLPCPQRHQLVLAERISGRHLPGLAYELDAPPRCAAVDRSPGRTRPQKRADAPGCPLPRMPRHRARGPRAPRTLRQQPQALSFACRACGALSVPRKKRASPAAMASIRLRRSGSVFRMGRQYRCGRSPPWKRALAVVEQVLRRDGGGDAGACATNELNGRAGADVLEHDAQPRKSLAQRGEHRLDEAGLAVEDIDARIGDLAVHQQWQVRLHHGVERLRPAAACRSRRPPSVSWHLPEYSLQPWMWPLPWRARSRRRPCDP